MAEIDWRKFIHSDPAVLLGKPVVKGTRLSVEFILGLYSEGWAEQQILENYPALTNEIRYPCHNRFTQETFASEPPCSPGSLASRRV